MAITSTEEEGSIPQRWITQGEIHATNREEIIHTLLGSCIGVVLFDPINQVAGLCHYLLPTCNGKVQNRFSYGEFALPDLIDWILRLGGQERYLNAKVYGGSNINNDGVLNCHGSEIGCMNIAFTFEFLQNAGIPVIEQDTGGVRGRKISLQTATMQVHCRTIGDKDKDDRQINSHKCVKCPLTPR